MDRMLVVVFDNETKAGEGKTALLELDRDGEITVYGCAVILKHADGTASLIESDDVTPFEGLGGTALGSFIALLGGPTGLSPSALIRLADLDNSHVGADFVDEIAAVLLPNRVAVVAEIDEESTELVDTRIDVLGGIVCRRAEAKPHMEFGKKEIEAMKADLARLKSELAREWSERGAKLQEKIEQLDARIQTRLEESDRRYDAAEKQRRIRTAILRKNAIAPGRTIRDLANTPVL